MNTTIIKFIKVKEKSILYWSIGNKFVLIFLLMAILPMSLTAYYNLTYAQNIVEDITKEDLKDISSSNAQYIWQLLEENQRTSKTLAGDPKVIEFLCASPAEQQILMDEINQTLLNFADTHPDYDAPGLLNVSGIVVASLEPTLIGKNRSFREYFQVSIQGKSFISDILVGRGTGRPGVFLTNPVFNTSGEILGINIIWLKADVIRDIIEEVEIGKKGIAYLVDQDGVIIAHPDDDLLYHSLGKLSSKDKDEIRETIRFGTYEGTDEPYIPKNLHIDDLADEISSNKGPETFCYESPLDNKYHIVGYTRLERQHWTVVVDLPEEQYQSQLQILAIITGLSVGLVVVIVFVISIILIRNITKPLRILSEAAVAVEKNQPFEPSTIEDITSGHDEIAHLGRVFSSMVISLRQELTERKRAEQLLQETLKKLRRTNVELEQFAYVASHDLQEPLRMIASFTQLLEKRYKHKLDTDADDFINYIVDGAKRMQELINDLLIFSRIGRSEKLFKKIDINIVLKNVLENLRQSIEETNAKITHDPLPTIIADESEFLQLFQNLISNAIKFHSEEPPRVHVSAKLKNGQWVFSVRDNGIGIDSKYFERIFIIFQRLHKKDEYGGTGIGLALCKKIVQRHRGKIWVESEVGKGSTFYFLIPKERQGSMYSKS